VSAGATKAKDMGDLPQWVCWRAELREGKATKVPYWPGSGSRARSGDPATWGTLSEARKAVREGDYDGIGFVFTESDPFCGVDLDACVDPKTGEIASWASEIVEALDSYTEFSPSGTGLHVLLRAKLPPGGNRRARIEMYDRGRFFTVTGRRLRGTSRVVEERQEQLSALHDSLFSSRERDVPERQGKVAPDNGLNDDEVLRRATSAANGPRFAALWAGEEQRTALRENKHALIRHVERERRRLEEAAGRGLVIKWGRESGYLSLHDPTTGEWHEVRASDCPPSVAESAKAHRRRRGKRR
jgi:primase-polymerase (primpol)-like protein